MTTYLARESLICPHSESGSGDVTGPRAELPAASRTSTTRSEYTTNEFPRLYTRYGLFLTEL